MILEMEASPLARVVELDVDDVMGILIGNIDGSDHVEGCLKERMGGRQVSSG